MTLHNGGKRKMMLEPLVNGILNARCNNCSNTFAVIHPSIKVTVLSVNVDRPNLFPSLPLTHYREVTIEFILFQERSDMFLRCAVSQQALCLARTYHFLPERVLTPIAALAEEYFRQE
jgi:hypothetical protein